MDQDLNESESVTEIESNEPETVESNEPETMLEAIQDGLKTDEPEAEEAKEPEVKPEEVAKEPENEDEPPEGISKKAQERFRNLTSRLKEKDAEVEHLSRDLGNIRTMMKETGGKPEDFAKTFEYIRSINKGDFDNARSILEEQIKQLTVITGKPFGNVDPLSSHPDLRERVNAYQMDEPTALEMARHRAMQQAQIKEQQEYQQRTQSQQYATQVRNDAISQIDRMGSEWARTDPDYAMKEGMITAQAKEIMNSFPPQQWPAQVNLMYRTISSMPVNKQVTNTPAPLRASGQSAGQRQPTSMLEALQNGLGY